LRDLDHPMSRKLGCALVFGIGRSEHSGVSWRYERVDDRQQDLGARRRNDAFRTRCAVSVRCDLGRRSTTARSGSRLNKSSDKAGRG